ncbi:MAG: cytochrome c biogenesis protein ResB [Pseudobdellovibrionaceae bacterium]|nr:MAG: cytochrome c biogenesis protein ResB [Pseudobdellovibrionaceae bacterium]
MKQIIKKYSRLTWSERLFKFLASIELAVLVILSLGIISAVGTIYEANYDAKVAQKLVYHSPYMYFVLGLLCINLVNVMVDRWPWKRHHMGFVLAHVGIILLLLGSLMTRYWGIDGSMTLEMDGGTNRWITVDQTELRIFASFENGEPTTLHHRDVDFLLQSPKDHPLQFLLGKEPLVVTDYYHYSLPKMQVVGSSDASDGPALRVQLQNERVSFSEWIFRRKSKPYEVVNLGPAKIILSDGSYQSQGGNEIILEPDSQGKIKYAIFTESQPGKVNRGTVEAGTTIATGWMGLQLRFLKYLPQARQDVQFEYRKGPTPLTTPAVQVEYKGEKHWIGQNSSLRLFSGNTAYWVSFGQKRLPLGFGIGLKEFKVGRYQGTMRAASYSSDVEVEGLGEQEISMNNPLKHRGFTFYQASFTEDERGQPTASILSVNKDPGRPVKNLGSFLIVLGSIILFYFKRMKLKASSSKKATQGAA